ncbi:MAG: hypothetical protein JXP34_00870 [Planctomycetes bacterium]|nr:hypothetical protein [Planctomycetota bacterium]
MDAIDGAIVREAEAHGISAPVERILRDLVGALEETARRGAEPW